MNEQNLLEENKKVVIDFQLSYNNRDWEKMIELLHEKFPKSMRSNSKLTEYNKKKYERWLRFVTAIFDKNTAKEYEENRNKYFEDLKKSPRSAFIENLKFWTKKEPRTINEIHSIADGDEIWSQVLVSGTGFYRGTQYQFLNDIKYFIQDGKIIDIWDNEDSFMFFTEIGFLKVRNGEKDELIEYMNSLIDIGLLPKNAGIID